MVLYEQMDRHLNQIMELSTHSWKKKKKRRKRKGQYKKLTWSGIYLRTVAKPLATEALREGETGEFPKNTSKRTIVTFIDLIVASTEEGRPSDEMQTSILDGSIQVKNMKVPFLRDRPWKMLRNVERADTSTGLGALILGEIASSKASQKVLPSTSLTSTICNDFSRGIWKIESNKDESPWISVADRPFQAFNLFEIDWFKYNPAA